MLCKRLLLSLLLLLQSLQTEFINLLPPDHLLLLHQLLLLMLQKLLLLLRRHLFDESFPLFGVHLVVRRHVGLGLGRLLLELHVTLLEVHEEVVLGGDGWSSGGLDGRWLELRCSCGTALS